MSKKRAARNTKKVLKSLKQKRIKSDMGGRFGDDDFGLKVELKNLNQKNKHNLL